MRILCVSDEESSALWDYGTPERMKKYDLILACGDLKADYLTHLVTLARCPLLYVHGNHDESYRQNPPEGCDCIDGGIVVYNGLRIMGLGGCRKYRNSRHHYTDRKMRWRLMRMHGRLWRMDGVDIVMTHASPEGLGDGEDHAHRGFPCFRKLLDSKPPGYWLFGHCHLYPGMKRIIHYGGTILINCFGAYELELPDREVPQRERNRIIWKTRKPRFDDEWKLP